VLPLPRGSPAARRRRGRNLPAMPRPRPGPRPRPRLPLARRLLARDRARLALTVLGVALTVALVLFLLTVYQGAREEANAYVASRPVDVWVSHRSATSLVRSASFLPADLGRGLETLPGVRRASPLLRGLVAATVGGEPVTLFLLGVHPDAPATRPETAAGRPSPGPGELVVDRAFAARYGLGVGDTVAFGDDGYRVAGLSRGTNAIVVHVAFATLPDAQRLLGLEGVVSHFLVEADPGVPAAVVADTLAARFDELSSVPAEHFALANLREIESGILPLLASVAAFGALAGGAVLALLLYGAVAERRVDYAVLKAIGAGERQVTALVLRQAALAVGAGLAGGALLLVLSAPLFRRLVPEIAFGFAPWIAVVTVGGATLLGLAAAWLPVRRLRRVWPAEAFRP